MPGDDDENRPVLPEPPPAVPPARGYRRPGRPSAVSQAEVDRAALALLRQGEKPSIDGVRAITGGSPHTLGPLLENFWRRLFYLSQLLGEAFGQLPGSLPALAEAFVIGAMDEAYQLVRAPAAELRAALDRRADDLEVRTHALRHAEHALRERLTTHDRQLEAVQGQLREQTVLARKLLDARDAAEQRVRTLEAQLQRQPPVRAARPPALPRTKKSARRVTPARTARRRDRKGSSPTRLTARSAKPTPQPTTRTRRARRLRRR